MLDGNFEHFYYLTNDHHGEVLLQLLCEPELKASLDEILMENLSESRAGWPDGNTDLLRLSGRNYASDLRAKGISPMH